MYGVAARGKKGIYNILTTSQAGRFKTGVQSLELD